ncbi:MAG: PrgI family protein [Clostridiales bacterium]|nr:PrgI family protein [Clostridiales bacterium]
MAYVQVPKDLTRVKTKVMFNLTKRQLICFSLAGVTGIPFYLLTKNAIGSTMAATFMVLIALPFFLFAMYEKDGRPLEKILMNIIQAKLIRSGVRPYRTENFYAAIQQEIYEKEVLGIGAEEKHKSGKKKSSGKQRQDKGKKRA